MSNSAFVSPAAANSSVGQTRFSGTRGHVGIVSFAREPAAARGGIPKWLPFVAAALALPLGLAVAVSANAPPLSSAAVTYLPPAISTLAAMVVYYWATLQVCGHQLQQTRQRKRQLPTALSSPQVSFARRRFGVQPPATTGVSIDFDRECPRITCARSSCRNASRQKS